MTKVYTNIRKGTVSHIRITGYLVGTIDRFNDAKATEVKERVKHGLGK